MKSLFVALCLFLFVSASECEEGELFVEVKKHSKQNSIEEAYEIMDGDRIVAVSPIFTDNCVNITQYCIPVNENYQYTIKMLSEGPLGWQPGSFIEVMDEYKTVLYKGYPLYKSEESAPLSFLKLLPMNSIWKMTTDPQGNWKDIDYDDSDWDEVDLEDPPTDLTGNQYFRKIFKGTTGFAAYEARINYQDGAAMFLNGKEIFRDNLPDGPITPAMNATKSNYSPEFRGAIRNFLEVSEDANLLAVELHYKEPDLVRNVTFNAMISAFPSNVKDKNCFVVGTSPAVREQGKSSQGGLAFNYNMVDYWNPKFRDGLMMLKFTYGYVRPAINALELYPDKNNLTMPLGFIFSANTEGDSKVKHTPLMIKENLEYIDYTNLYVTSDMALYSFEYYYLNITHGRDSSIRLPEIHPVVCAVEEKPVFSYPSFIWQVAEYSILYPIQVGFRYCTVEPTLPEGLFVDYNACTIYGTPKEAPYKKEFTITAGHWKEYHTTVTISVISCPTNPIEIERVYSTGKSDNEGFIIMDERNNTIWSESTPQKQSYNHTFCTSASSFFVTLSSPSTAWKQGSYLIIRSLLDNTNRTLARLRYDDRLHLPHAIRIPLYSANDYDDWYYNMDFIPETWYDEDVEGWDISHKDDFPEAPTQLQFFKRRFSIADLDSVSGLEIDLKHRYGVVIYLNGQDVYRWGVSGPITNETFSGHAFSKAHVLSLFIPGFIKTEKGTEYILKDENWIAIALVAVSLDHPQCYFSASIRPVLSGSSRMIDFAYASIGMKDVSYAFDDYGATSFSNSGTLRENYIEIDFGDNREWINAVSFTNQATSYGMSPTSFVIIGRIRKDFEWVELKRIDNMEFWENGQEKVIFFENLELYSQFRISILMEDMTQQWYLSRLSLLSFVPESQEPLQYPPIQGYSGYEMNRMYPLVSSLTSFTIQPPLHSLTMDSVSGTIVGTPTMEDVGTYTVSAMNWKGESQSTEITISISECPENYANVLISLIVDSLPSYMGYELYDADQKQIGSMPMLRIPNLNYNRTFCLPQADYSAHFISYNTKGWMRHTGYEILVNDIQVAYGSVGLHPNPPRIEPVSFTTKQVLTSGVSLYRVSTSYEEGWMTKNFDDSLWEVLTDRQFPPNVTSLYIRTTLPSIVSNLTSLAIQLGLTTDFNTIVYHNGNYVGENRKVVSLVDSLETSGVLAIAFTQALPTRFVCSLHAQYAYTSVLPIPVKNARSDLKDGKAEYLFDHDPTTLIIPRFHETKGFIVEWDSDQPHGAQFNAISFTVHEEVHFSMRLYAKTDEQEDIWTLLVTKSNIYAYDRTPAFVESTFGLAHFKHFYLNVTILSDPIPSFISLDFHYLRPLEENACATEEDFLAVNNKEWSYSECDALHVGYRMRYCENAVFGPIDESHCQDRYPTYFHYPQQNYTFFENEVIQLIPEYDGILEMFELDAEVPFLSINEEGVIEGEMQVIPPTNVLVVGSNANFTITTELLIEGIAGTCQYHGTTLKVRDTCSVPCSKENILQRGMIHLRCIVKDGELFLEMDRECSVVMGVTVLVVIIVAILLLIALIFRKRKQPEEKEPLV